MAEVLATNTFVNETYDYSVPIAQVGPRLVDTSVVMMNLFTHPVFRKEIVASLEYDVPVISEIEDLEFLLKHVQPIRAASPGEADYSPPRSFTLDQVKAGFHKESVTIGFVVGVIQWSSFFRDVLPGYVNGIIVKVASDCGKNFTYVVNGGREDEWYFDENVTLDRKYQYLEQRYKFFWKAHHEGKSRHCHFDLLITPSEEFAENYLTKAPLIWGGIVTVIFFVALAMLFCYDYSNHKNQVRISRLRARAEAVVASLFPEQVGAQILEEHARRKQPPRIDKDSEWQVEAQERRSKPMAELFPSASILFADIKGK
jgi:hypothetical protein